MTAGLLLLGGLIAFPFSIRIIWAIERRLFPNKQNRGPFGTPISRENATRHVPIGGNMSYHLVNESECAAPPSRVA